MRIHDSRPDPHEPGIHDSRPDPHEPVDTGIPDPTSARTVTVYDNYLVEPEGSLDVRFLGNFDAVGSFGVPGNNIDLGKDFSITPGTQVARHAVSEDENRIDFDLQSMVDPSNPNDSRINEQVFSGNHCDVISMCANNTLSNDPLYWMVTGAQEAGVPIASPVEDDLPGGANDINRHSHNTMLGLGGWTLRQWSDLESTNVPRTVYYSNNPPSPYDVGQSEETGSIDSMSQVDMPEHRNFLNDIAPGAGDPLIYNQGGDGIHNPNAMQDLLDSIYSEEDGDSEE